jgi:hypothetical protein
MSGSEGTVYALKTPMTHHEFAADYPKELKEVLQEL